MERQGKSSSDKRLVYRISTYDLRCNKFEFEVVGLDQSSFSEVERESDKNLSEKHSHFGDYTYLRAKIGNMWSYFIWRFYIY